MEEDIKTKTEQILRECILKVTQIVLQARVSPVSVGRRNINKWFNLEIEDREETSRELEEWKNDLFLPLVINIYFQTGKDNKKVLLEQWKFTYSTRTTNEVIEIPTLYKKLVIFFRTLYSYLRILPAYKLWRHCKKNIMSSSKIVYDLSKTDSPLPLEKPVRFQFADVNTQFGKIQFEVKYTQQCSLKTLLPPDEALLSSRFIIPDYTPTNAATDIPLASSPASLESRSKPIGIPSRALESFSPPSSITLAQYSPYATSVAETPPPPFHQAFGPASPPFSTTPPTTTFLPTVKAFSSTPPFAPSDSVPALDSTGSGIPVNKSSSAPGSFKPGSAPRMQPAFKLSVSPFKESTSYTEHSSSKIKATGLPILTNVNSSVSEEPLPSSTVNTEEQIPSFVQSLNMLKEPETQSDIGYFVLQCQTAPSLALFESNEKGFYSELLNSLQQADLNQ